MNREMRRLQAKEEERAKKRRSGAPRQQKSSKDEGLSLFGRIRKYLREVRSELKKVNWPTRQELTTYSIVVFGMTTILTLVVFGMDWAFNRVIISLLDAIT